MNKYRVYFKDGSSDTCNAIYESEAKFIVCNRKCRPLSDVDRVCIYL